MGHDAKYPPPSVRLDLTAVSAPKRPRCVEIAEAVPQDVLLHWAANLYTLMNMGWDYVETVLDVVIQMRLSETKPLVRRVRELKREYDRFRSRAIDSRAERNERECAEAFEDFVQKHLSRLFNALEFETMRQDIRKDYATLVIATQQAMTILDAVSMYARRCDREIRERYRVDVPDRCMVQGEFLALYGLVPQFAGDCYDKDLPARKLTAGILINELLKTDIGIYWD